MSINTLITNIINGVFHVIWFTCMTLEPKYSRKKTVLIFSVTSVFFLILMIVMSYITILAKMFYIVSYFLAAIFYGIIYIFGVSKTPSKAIFLMSAYYCLWTFIYNVNSYATDSFAGAGNEVIWLLRIGLNLFFLFLYRFFFKKRFLLVYHDIRHGDSNITILSVLTFYMASLLVISNEKMHMHSAYFLYILISVYIFVVVVYVVLFRFMERLNHEWRFKQMQFHEKFLLAQIDSYEEMEQNARQTRHDFRHHNIVVAEFAKNRDYQGILDYLQKYEEEETAKYTKTFCANHAVDNVLSFYVVKAEQKGIEIKTDICLPDTSGISDYDLVSVLANVLENAISGCMRTEKKKWISLWIRRKGNKLVIVCKNSCISDIIFENGIPRNINRDSVGVESILQSVSKYSGDADFTAVDGIFTCSVIMGSGKCKVMG